MNMQFEDKLNSLDNFLNSALEQEVESDPDSSKNHKESI